MKKLEVGKTFRRPADFRQHPWPPRVQVAGVSSLEEALFCGSVGVDSVGLTLGLPSGTHDELTESKARAIVNGLRPVQTAVLITYISDAHEASELVEYVRPDVVQFHGGMTDSELAMFRRLCPQVKTIGCINVIDETSLSEVSQFSETLWDALILDSIDPESGKRGATGRLHDWTVSARIVELSHLPVILAGGLRPDNVGSAIRKVRPAGVDAHTGLENADGTRSFDKIRRFAEAALNAFEEINVI